MIEIRADAIPLKCACCGTPFAVIQDGMLIIKAKHHSGVHVNVIPLVSIPQAVDGTLRVVHGENNLPEM